MQVSSFQGTKHFTPVNTAQMDVLVREARSKIQQYPILCLRFQKETSLNKRTYFSESSSNKACKLNMLLHQPSFQYIYKSINLYRCIKHISIITVYHIAEYINISVAQNNLCTPFVLSSLEMRQMTFSSGWKKKCNFLSWFGALSQTKLFLISSQISLLLQTTTLVLAVCIQEGQSFCWINIF